MASGNIAGISTVGALTGYAVETVAGTKPEKFKLLHRINASDEIAIDVETMHPLSKTKSRELSQVVVQPVVRSM